MSDNSDLLPFSFNWPLATGHRPLPLRTVALLIMQVYVGLVGDLKAAEAAAGRLAAIGDDPLQAEQVGELFDVRLEGHEGEAGVERFAAGLVAQAVERALPVIGFEAAEARQADGRRVERED